MNTHHIRHHLLVTSRQEVHNRRNLQEVEVGPVFVRAWNTRGKPPWQIQLKTLLEKGIDYDITSLPEEVPMHFWQILEDVANGGERFEFHGKLWLGVFPEGWEHGDGVTYYFAVDFEPEDEDMPMRSSTIIVPHDFPVLIGEEWTTVKDIDDVAWP